MRRSGKRHRLIQVRADSKVERRRVEIISCDAQSPLRQRRKITYEPASPQNGTEKLKKKTKKTRKKRAISVSDSDENTVPVAKKRLNGSRTAAEVVQILSPKPRKSDGGASGYNSDSDSSSSDSSSSSSSSSEEDRRKKRRKANSEASRKVKKSKKPKSGKKRK